MKFKICFPFLLLPLLTACGSRDQPDRENVQEETPVENAVEAAPDVEEPVELAYLAEFVGRRPAAVDLWQTQPLRSRLQGLLGSDLQFYLDIMQEAMPLTRDGDVIYTVGVAPDDAVPGVGYLLIDPEQNGLSAFGVFGDKRVEAQSPGAAFAVPAAVQKKVDEVLGG